MAKKIKKNIAKPKKKKNPVQVNDQPTVTLIQAEAVKEEPENKKEQKKDDKVSKKKSKNDHPGIFKRSTLYFKGTFAELKKVQWLSSDQLMKSSGSVAVIVAAFTGVTWIIDSVFGVMASLLIGA